MIEKVLCMAKSQGRFLAVASDSLPLQTGKVRKIYTKISTGHMERNEWLQLRKSGIGGSDAGAICGLNPFSSPMKVFLDKTGDSIDAVDNEAMRQGRDLEDYVARRFMETTGLKVRRSNYMYRSQEHSFMIADVDRLIIGEDAGLECKTASAYNADKWKDNQIPVHYLLQCFHYMAVTGKKAWYIAVVLLGKEFQFRRIERDEELIRQLIAVEERYWTTYVLPKRMPEPDGSKICDEILEQYFHTARKDSAVSLTGFDDKLQRREQILYQLSELQKEQNQIEQEIKAFMQDNELAYNDRYRVTWSNVETARLDTKRIKEERPDIYRDYARIAKTRRFQIKAA